MVNDLPNIVSTLSETANVNVQSNNPDDVQKLLDDLFQFLLGHLMDIARQDDHISDKETELLEMIAERLEQPENYKPTSGSFRISKVSFIPKRVFRFMYCRLLPSKSSSGISLRLALFIFVSGQVAMSRKGIV